MAHGKRTNALGVQLLANAALALAHSRGEYTPARVKVVLVLAHPDDEPTVASLTAEQRAAIAAGAEVAFVVRTPDAADGFTAIPTPRAATLLAQLRAGIALGDHAAVPTG